MQSEREHKSWTGFENIRNLVVFGDSYSSVGYAASSPHPSPQDPLGVPFPGLTWSEPGSPNWVGLLVTEYATHGPILAYDYACGGDDVNRVVDQIQAKFLPVVGQRPAWAPWSAFDTLFVTWVGINDCGMIKENEIDITIKKLFKAQGKLYDAGARNFLFIDLPPIHRTPMAANVPILRGDGAGRKFIKWNEALEKAIGEFSSDHAEAVTFTYSSWTTFSRVLDDPVSHGFKSTDAAAARGAIWADDLHPASKMHGVIALDLVQFLIKQA